MLSLLLLTLLPTLLPAAHADEHPHDHPRVARKAAKLEVQAAEALAPCAAAEDELACLDGFLAAWGQPTLRHGGVDVAVVLSSVDSAVAHRHALVVEGALADWHSQVEAAWAELRPQLADDTPAALALVDGFLARWEVDTIEVDGQTVAVNSDPVHVARALRTGIDQALRITVLESQLWQGGVLQPLLVPDLPAPRLRLRSSAKNQVIDVEDWFREHDLVVPERRLDGQLLELPQAAGPLPAAVPDRVGGLALTRLLLDGDQPVAVYGDVLQGMREPRLPGIVAVLGQDGALVRAWDLAAWQHAPGSIVGDELFVEQEVKWATAREGTLFLSTAHRTYAASSKGDNGYLSALDIETGALLWRSRPLVANANNFVLTPAHAITGYGFTAEPDYLYVLSLADGSVVRRVGVPTGPDYLFVRQDSLLVRTYDHDLVFEID